MKFNFSSSDQNDMSIDQELSRIFDFRKNQEPKSPGPPTCFFARCLIIIIKKLLNIFSYIYYVNENILNIQNDSFLFSYKEKRFPKKHENRLKLPDYYLNIA